MMGLNFEGAYFRGRGAYFRVVLLRSEMVGLIFMGGLFSGGLFSGTEKKIPWDFPWDFQKFQKIFPWDFQKFKKSHDQNPKIYEKFPKNFRKFPKNFL